MGGGGLGMCSKRNRGRDFVGTRCGGGVWLHILLTLRMYLRMLFNYDTKNWEAMSFV